MEKLVFRSARAPHTPVLPPRRRNTRTCTQRAAQHARRVSGAMRRQAQSGARKNKKAKRVWLDLRCFLFSVTACSGRGRAGRPTRRPFAACRHKDTFLSSRARPPIAPPGLFSTLNAGHISTAPHAPAPPHPHAAPAGARAVDTGRTTAAATSCGGGSTGGRAAAPAAGQAARTRHNYAHTRHQKRGRAATAGAQAGGVERR